MRRFAAARGLRERLRTGTVTAGAFVKIPSPEMVGLLAETGLDFVLVDAEHGPITPETCGRMVTAAEAAGIPCLVRIGETDSAGTVCRYLDTGVLGVHLPRIDTVSDANSAISACQYPPAGTRGLAASRWCGYGHGIALNDAMREMQQGLSIIVQIESRQAIDNLPELLTLDTPDVFFLGPTDLAADMSLGGQRSDPAVVSLLARAIDEITAAGKTAGIMAADGDEAARWVQAGVRYVAFNAERFVAWGAESAIRPLRELPSSRT